MLIKDDGSDLLSMSQSLYQHTAIRSSEFVDAKCSAQCTKNLQPRTLYKNSAATYTVQHRQPGPEVDTEKVARRAGMPGTPRRLSNRDKHKSAHQFLPFMCSAPSSQHEHFPSGPRLRCRPAAGAGRRRRRPAQPSLGAGGQIAGPGPTVRVTVLGFRRRVSRLIIVIGRSVTEQGQILSRRRRRRGLAASES
jgi:hypothetical protein